MIREELSPEIYGEDSHQPLTPDGWWLSLTVAKCTTAFAITTVTATPRHRHRSSHNHSLDGKKRVESKRGEGERDRPASESAPSISNADAIRQLTGCPLESSRDPVSLGN